VHVIKCCEHDDYKSKTVVSWWFLECMYTMLQMWWWKENGMCSKANRSGYEVINYPFKDLLSWMQSHIGKHH